MPVTPTEAWLQAARHYSSLPEAARAGYWNNLTADQQSALREALDFLAASSPAPAPPPPAPWPIEEARRPQPRGRSPRVPGASETGCLARAVEGVCGALVAASLAYLLILHFLFEKVHEPSSRKAIYAGASVLGGLMGLFLPEIFGRVRRWSRRAAAWLRLTIGLVTAVTLMSMIKTSLEASALASASSVSLAVVITLAFWLVFEATTSGLIRFEPGSFSAAIRTTLNEWVMGIVAGVCIGIFAGVFRMILGASDLTGNTGLFFLFPVVVMAAGVAIRLVLRRLFQGDPGSRKARRIAIADGIILGAFIGMITAMPSPPLQLGESTYRSAAPWLLVAPMVGFICGLLVGGASTLARFAVGHLVIQGGVETSREVLSELFGTAAIDPPREEPGEEVGQGEESTAPAEPPAGTATAAARPPKFAACCLAGCLGPVVVLVGLLVWGSRTVDSNGDFVNLPKGCPPACSSAKMAGFMLDCVPTVPDKCADFSGADLTEVDLHNASLFGGKFKRAVLRRANLKAASMGMGDFTEADLSEADLRGASLSGATLIGAKLTGADLRFVAFHGVNLIQADLSGAKLSGATYDSGTEWPRDFDPVAAGAKKEGF